MRRSLMVLLGLLAVAACRPLVLPRSASPPRHARDAVGPVERGAVTYATYCGSCHGTDADGRGPLAAMLGIAPADLRTPAIRTASDDALVARIVRGTPIRLPAGRARQAEELEVDALATYVPTLAARDWGVLRAGRVVFETSCAPCHGAYGRSEGVVARWLGVTDLVRARERLNDAALARLSEHGTGMMPPLHSTFDPLELRALIAYVRHLSEGFRVYDTYCATCHGDDGQGARANVARPPVPVLRGAYPRARLVHMLRRERGVMPHFRDVQASRLHDVVVYLRVLASRPPRSGGADLP